MGVVAAVVADASLVIQESTRCCLWRIVPFSTNLMTSSDAKPVVVFRLFLANFDQVVPRRVYTCGSHVARQMGMSLNPWRLAFALCAKRLNAPPHRLSWTLKEGKPRDAGLSH
jgi:hypothetical protein